MMPATESEYKGNPMIVLTQGPEDKFPFQFGLKKAKLLVDLRDNIKKFVTKHSKDPGSPQPMKPHRATRLSIHPDNPQGRHIARAVEALRNGGIVVYPTDTVYGLGGGITPPR